MLTWNDTVASEVFAQCIADHTFGDEVAVAARLRKPAKPGCAPHDPETGLCPSCGRLSHRSEQYKQMGGSIFNKVKASCYERADFVAELEYDLEDGRTFWATYGVILEGDSLNISCWMD